VEGAPEGSWRGSSAFGGGCLLDPDEGGAVSGTSLAGGFVHEGVSANSY